MRDPTNPKIRDEIAHQYGKQGEDGKVLDLLVDYTTAEQMVRELREVVHDAGCQAESECYPACQEAADWLLARAAKEGRK